MGIIKTIGFWLDQHLCSWHENKVKCRSSGKTFENVDLGGFCTYFRGNLLVKPDNTTERTVDCCMCSTMAVQGGSLLHISVAAIMGTVLFFVNQVIVEAIVVM
eukprot:TRINITY_DN1149_c0_g1_i24.p5 TRINITY_DN1149_c0_g1~~TRINITY_DN1149_c0_g1_i24.p5  ORF type:complete len:103 (+),score=6.30 TRINITY_DN1149_c0_g1_i24:169-477(+)